MIQIRMTRSDQNNQLPKLKADGDYFVPVAIFNAQPRLLEFLLLQKEENAIFWYKKEVDFILWLS